MTPPKDKLQYKYRPATVVYQRMTPELVLAYRIFSPGLAHQEGLEKLELQMHRIIDDVYIDEEVVVEDGKRMRKGVGILEDIKKQINVTEDQIVQAYDAYKAEIERMMEEDREHLAAKARGEFPDDDGSKMNNKKRGTKRKSSSSCSGSSPVEARGAKRGTSSRPIQIPGAEEKSHSSPVTTAGAKGKHPIDVVVDATADDNGNEEDDDDDDDDDEGDYDGDDEDDNDEGEDADDQNALYEVPTDRWMTKTEALAKLSDAQHRVAEMRNTVDLADNFYTTQMIPRHEITETFQSAHSYMTRLAAYVREIAEIVEGHDGQERQGWEVSIWGDDRTAVTRLVLRVIPMVDEIPLRVAAMEAILREVVWLRDQLAKAAVEPTRKRFRAKLAEFVKQAHTPVPPPYCGKRKSSTSTGKMDHDADRRVRDEDVDEDEDEEVGDEGSSDQGGNKRAKTSHHEVITIDD